MPERTGPNPYDNWANDINRRLRDVERKNPGIPDSSNPLQTYEDGSPLGDTFHLDFGANISATPLGGGYVVVEGAGGSGCGGATVTVAAFDSHDAAKDCADFVCTGTSDEVTLNAAVAECVLRSTTPSNDVLEGKILLFQGNYLLTAPWSNNTKPCRFQGMGFGTIIQAVSGFVGGEVISVTTDFGATDAKITRTSDMLIDAQGLVSRCIRMNGPFSPDPVLHRHHLENLFCQGATGVTIDGGDGQSPADFLRNVETSGGAVGIDCNSSNPGHIIGCRVSGTSSAGISTRSRVEACVVTNCDTGIQVNNAGTGTPDLNDSDTNVIGNIVSGGDIGIRANCQSSAIVGNVIRGVGEYGILADIGSGRNVISSNRILDSGTDGTFDGIRIHTDDNFLIGNKVRDCTGFGLRFMAGADNNWNVYNDLRGNTGGTYTDAGAGNLHVPTTSGTGAAPSNADYLVGTANGDLSAEIVVGTTPGGELGGTWAAPTVDATHSGSPHTDFIAKALVDAKGDVITATADNTPVRKAVGADGTALVASAAAGDGLVWGTPAVLNSAAATTPGAVVKKIEVFDAAGTSLGFLPVYDAIT